MALLVGLGLCKEVANRRILERQREQGIADPINMQVTLQPPMREPCAISTGPIHFSNNLISDYLVPEELDR
jgi:hypothetical protein